MLPCMYAALSLLGWVGEIREVEQPAPATVDNCERMNHRYLKKSVNWASNYDVVTFKSAVLCQVFEVTTPSRVLYCV